MLWRLERFDRVPFGLQPTGVEVLVGERRPQLAQTARAGRRASSSPRRRPSAWTRNARAVRRVFALCPPPHAATARTSAISGSRCRTTPRLYDRAREGDRHPRGRRAGGPLATRMSRTRSPAAGEVLVRMRFASLNHLDVWTRKGMPSVPKPRILGADGSGVVEALGEGVEGLEPGQPVVINPGLEHGAAIHVIGEHTQGVHAELAAIPATNVYPLRGRRLVRGRGCVPAGLRDCLPDARHARRAAGGRVGAGLGDRRRRRDGGVPDRPGARREDDRHLVERREAGARCRARRRRHRQPRVRRRRRHGEGGTAAARTWSSRRSARRPGSARSTPSAPGGRVIVCGATSGPEPAGRAAPCLVEADRHPRLDDGHPRGLRRRLRPGRRRRDAGDRLDSSRSPRPAPPTSGWRRASSSGRSCSSIGD